MEIFDLKNLKLSGKDIIIHYKNIIKYCSKIFDDILNIDNDSKNSDKKFKLIIKYLYIVDFYYMLSGAGQLIFNFKEYKECDIMLNNLIDSFYDSKIIYDFLLNFLKNTNETEKLIFITKLINIFDSYKKCNNCSIKKEINNITCNLRNIIENPTVINLEELKKYNIDSEIKNYFPELKNKNLSLNLDTNTYIFLQKKIKNRNARCNLAKLYLKKTNLCINEFSKLLIKRHEYANILGYKNFYEYKKKNVTDTEELKNLIADLSNKVELRAKKEIDRLLRELNKDNNKSDSLLEPHDFIFYYNKLKTKYCFSLEKIIETVFFVIKKNFNLTFKKINHDKQNELLQDNLWNSKILKYEAFDSDKNSLGFLYLDLLFNDNKNINEIISICLNHKYGKIPTQILLIGNYENFNKQNITFNEIIDIFKEFGNIIKNFYSQNTYGFKFLDTDFKNIVPQIMEYICWENETIHYLLNHNNNEKIISEHIKFMRYIDFAYIIKYKCTNALFDHIIHSSDEIIDSLKNNKKSVLSSLYKNIFINILSNDKFTKNINLTQNIILNEINDSEGTLYSNIISEILSYGIYQVIKRYGSTEFINKILKNNKISTKKLIFDFIGKSNANIYDLYLNEIINYQEIDTEVNIKLNNTKNKNNILSSDINCFQSQSHHSDFENIMSIK
jgi:hypothetical protein